MMKNNQIKKLFLKWKQIEIQCSKLSSQIENCNTRYDTIVSIGRGGMIPSRLIAEKLNIMNIDIFNCRSYIDIANQGKMISGHFNYDVLNNKKVLIVDDVYTTGNTLNFVCEEIYRNVDDIFISTATMYLNSHEKLRNKFPNFWSEEYDAKREWLVFPWEYDKDRK